MTVSTLHYVYDPLCGWCYAAGPLVRAAADAGVAIVLHGGGLWDTPAHVGADKREYMRRSDARIAEMTGVTFGPGYLDNLLMDPATVFWSRPVIAAILAAGGIEPGADLRMLRAVQQAHYGEGRRVVETPVLTSLAGSIGLAAEAFGPALDAAPVDGHVAASRTLMRRAGVRGFPAFLLERGGGLARVEHEPFYGRPADFVKALDRPRRAS